MDNADPELAALLAAYRAARAEHDAAAKALRAATTGAAPPDPRILRRQGAAAMAEYEALRALRLFQRLR